MNLGSTFVLVGLGVIILVNFVVAMVKNQIVCSNSENVTLTDGACINNLD